MNEAEPTVQVPVSLPTREQIAKALYRAKYPASSLTLAGESIMERSRLFAEADAVLALFSHPIPTAEPPRIEDMAPGRRWPEGVYAINFQPGYYPSIVMPDVDGEDLLYEDGTWWNPSEGDTLTRLDPSTIRDVTPPKDAA